MRKFLTLFTILLFSGVFVFAQNKVVSGIVTDAQGKALSDVSVQIKGTQVGTITSSDGRFTLSVPSNAKTLVFSSVGMQAQEVAIGTKTTFNVNLEASNEALSEVIINVPYGTITKKAFTGSENTITAKAIQKQQVTSVTKALEGLIPGITATNGGGAPGSSASVLIRGVGSVNASSSPLYVLNGVPYDGSITALSTDDIESVTVLKDAAATAMYGSQANAGVIVVTTKKAKTEEPAFEAKITTGFRTPDFGNMDMMNGSQLYNYQKQFS